MILEMVMIMPKMMYYMLNVMLLLMVRSVIWKKMQLKQMYIKLVDDSVVLDDSLDESVVLPYTPIMSDPYSFENVIKLL